MNGYLGFLCCFFGPNFAYVCVF